MRAVEAVGGHYMAMIAGGDDDGDDDADEFGAISTGSKDTMTCAPRVNDLSPEVLVLPSTGTGRHGLG